MTNTHPRQDKLHQHAAFALQSIHTNDESMIGALHTCHQIDSFSDSELTSSIDVNKNKAASSQDHKTPLELSLQHRHIYLHICAKYQLKT